jgi:hypothetical protein
MPLKDQKLVPKILKVWSDKTFFLQLVFQEMGHRHFHPCLTFVDNGGRMSLEWRV